MQAINLKKFLIFQSLLLVCGSLVALIFGGAAFFSYFLGAFLMLFANILMLWRFFMRKKVFSPMKELLFLYFGEMLKLTVVALGSIVIAIYIKPIFMIYLAGLIVLQIAMWLMPFFLIKTGLK
tara:strand:- start:355 stop:723 length:369 start_codon:yes stop_codon:yes gene_type:complete